MKNIYSELTNRALEIKDIIIPLNIYGLIAEKGSLYDTPNKVFVSAYDDVMQKIYEALADTKSYSKESYDFRDIDNEERSIAVVEFEYNKKGINGNILLTVPRGSSFPSYFSTSQIESLFDTIDEINKERIANGISPIDLKIRYEFSIPKKAFKLFRQIFTPTKK